MKNSLSAVIITKNEANNIEACLKALTWVEEMVIVDGFSDDGTQKKAESLGAKVYEFTAGFAEAKNLGIEKASCEWILSIDADEIVTKELAEEIQATLTKGPKEEGFYIPRRNHIGSRWIRYAGYYPDLQLRLFKKNAGRFKNVEVHERVELKGDTLIMNAPLIHHTYSDIDAYYRKVDHYARLEASQAIFEGIKSSPVMLVLSPLKQFLKVLVREQGWREGVLGVQLAYGMALYAWKKHRIVISGIDRP